MSFLHRSLLALATAALPAFAQADTALVAVATNFVKPAEKLAADLKAATGHEITVSGGATGKLYAQISEGAPFDALLAADAKTPARLVTDGAAASDPFPYATGVLVLWSADPAHDLSDPKAALAAARHVAVANPDVAPYGKAAMETLDKLGLTDTLKDHIVTGENIGQTQTLVASGAAEIGFVAASGLAGDAGGSRWDVPADLHAPIRQDAVLLKHGEGNAAAKAFLDYLASDAGKAVIASYGYVTGN